MVGIASVVTWHHSIEAICGHSLDDEIRIACKDLPMRDVTKA